MPTHAMLVIDMLNDFFRGHARLAEQRQSLVSAVNRAAEAFRQHRQPVIWVRQEFAPDLSDAFLDMRRRNLRTTIAGTDGCETLPELVRLPGEEIIIKKRYSAFFGTRLDATLAALRPRTVVLAGINTHACVRTTAIDAYQRDYEVLIVSDGVASYDDEHDRITRQYLDGKIAQFLHGSEVTKRL